MRVNRIILKTKAEGPGVRACIWVQGCEHRCKGCYAKHLWNRDEGRLMRAEEIIDALDNVIDEIDGITLLGGEPMDQASELWKVARYIKEHEKNVICFTGYTYEQLLEAKKPGVEKLLEYTDILADGPYIEELRSFDRPLLGSSNQRFIFITNNIDKKEIENYKNSFELRVSSMGVIQINGMGNLDKLTEYIKRIEEDKNEVTVI